MILNDQTPEPVFQVPPTPNSRLDVHSIFYTLQGEGPHSGTPAVFVRLAGCNLRCLMCDTDYTSTRSAMSAADIAAAIQKVGDPQLIVISGGEPFRQPAIMGVIPELNWILGGKRTIQIETNGTLGVTDHEWTMLRLTLSKENMTRLELVVSPKTGRLHHMYKRQKSGVYYKYVMNHRHVDPEDGLPTSVLGTLKPPARPPVSIPPQEIFLQPEDVCDADENTANLQACVESCLTFGYRLCLQTHKLVRLP